MGKKKTDEEAPKVEAVEDEEEDTPVVKALKEIDIRYCKIETEYEQEIEKLRKKFWNEKQAAIIAERAKVLASTDDAPKEDHEFGTPACKGFWLQAMQNCEEFADILEEWDDPVLEYVSDVKAVDLNDDLPQKGYKLEFVFKENPYFTNESLWVEFHTNYDPDNYQPWKASEIKEMKAVDIDWKPGKNITVAITAKKVKGGGAKKAKQKGKEKQEDRPSFFRAMFRNLKSGEPLPDDLLNIMTGGDEDIDIDGDEHEEIFRAFVGNCIDPLRHTMKDCLIPYAVRYYSGEIDTAEDDEDEESEEESDDEDDDDSESEEPRGKAGKKKGGKAKADAGGAGGKKEEECKQQ